MCIKKLKKIFYFSMEKQYVKYKGKSYEINEPTIEDWSRIMVLQEWSDEREFSTILLSQITGLSQEEIENADYQEILDAAQTISKYFLTESTDFKNEFEFNGKKYKFLDLPNLKFGEFIDIDGFLTKPVVEKKKEMNLLMALLYREVDEKGEYLPYDSSKVQLRAEEFKKLPVKYVNGASSFFLRLDKILRGNIKLSFWSRMTMTVRMIYLLVKFLALIVFGVGSVLLLRLPTKILQRWTKSRNTR
jgi:hypothetical protein